MNRTGGQEALLCGLISMSFGVARTDIFLKQRLNDVRSPKPEPHPYPRAVSTTSLTRSRALCNRTYRLVLEMFSLLQTS